MVAVHLFAKKVANIPDGLSMILKGLSFSPVLIQISMVVAHSPRPPTWPRNHNTHSQFEFDLEFFLL